MESTSQLNTETISSVELSPELKRLEKAQNPLQIFKEMSLLGISSGVKSIKNIILLIVVNFVFLLVGIYLFFSGSFAYKKLFFLLLVVGIGILFVFIAIKKVFDLLKLEYASYLFKQFEGYIHKIFGAIFEKTAHTTEKIVSRKQLNHIFQGFIPKIPKAFQKPLLFILSFTPMVGFVADIYATDNLNSYEKQSDALYEKVQLYLKNSVKEERSGYWLIWALLINGLLQGLLLYWLS